MRIAVLTAGLSTPSSSRILADELASAVVRSLAERGETAQVDVVELREHGHALVDAMLTGFAPPALQDAIDAASRADGLIAVTPIFTASYSPLFKAFFDVLDKDALAGKPVLIGATGGTERHSLALEHAVRPLLSFLRAYVTPTAVYAASADFGPHADELRARIERAARELAGLMTAVGPEAMPAEFDDFVPFGQLLAASAR